MLAGPPGIEEFEARAKEALGRKSRWVRPLCKRIFARFGSGIGAQQRAKLIEFIEADHGYADAWLADAKPRIQHYFLTTNTMAPRVGALARCALPNIPTSVDLAAWLDISIEDLEWFADVRHMIKDTGPLCHYHFRWLAKRSGGWRLVESPKQRLRDLQRKILRGILDPVMPHEAAHGFRRGRSCLTNARQHCGKDVLLRMDLLNFFTSIPASRIHALFTALGYPDPVAKRLTGLCTCEVTSRMLPPLPAGEEPLPWAMRKRYAERHLPQGAPTSPALANLCALHLDFRLSGLAESIGGAYTRYADDLAISAGEALRRRTGAITSLVYQIVKEQRFDVNHRKTRVMHRSNRQRLTGVVVNDKPNVSRAEFDQWKAVLHNCVVHGPQSQNRMGHPNFREHLRGRVSYVMGLNAERGEKLKRVFEEIDWGR